MWGLAGIAQVVMGLLRLVWDPDTQEGSLGALSWPVPQQQAQIPPRAPHSGGAPSTSQERSRSRRGGGGPVTALLAEPAEGGFGLIRGVCVCLKGRVVETPGSGAGFPFPLEPIGQGHAGGLGRFLEEEGCVVTEHAGPGRGREA